LRDIALPSLLVHHGTAPMIISIPHSGLDIPDPVGAQLVSDWIARKDTDWWVDELYAFAVNFGVTVVRTRISRTAIDVNRDPSGRSLYPGQASTDLCPITTFDGEALYQPGNEPLPADIDARRAAWYEPYHATLQREIRRLRDRHACVVLYDAHSIRSNVPRLFEGSLPEMNLGTFSGRSCAPLLAAELRRLCADSRFSFVCDGRFKGGYITRHYGQPGEGVHAVQMELACRSYLREPQGALGADNWPPPFDAEFAAPLAGVLERLIHACLQFAAMPSRTFA
jgi:N-formylglutamate deformylase